MRYSDQWNHERRASTIRTFELICSAILLIFFYFTICKKDFTLFGKTKRDMSQTNLIIMIKIEKIYKLFNKSISIHFNVKCYILYKLYNYYYIFI